MPRDTSTHTLHTTLYVELGSTTGPHLELPAFIEWTFQPGDNRPPRPTDIDPPEPDSIEDVTVRVRLGNEDSPIQYRRIKDPTLETALLRGLEQDLLTVAQEDRQAEYEAAQEVE